MSDTPSPLADLFPWIAGAAGAASGAIATAWKGGTRYGAIEARQIGQDVKLEDIAKKVGFLVDGVALIATMNASLEARLEERTESLRRDMERLLAPREVA